MQSAYRSTGGAEVNFVHDPRTMGEFGQVKTEAGHYDGQGHPPIKGQRSKAAVGTMGAGA